MYLSPTSVKGLMSTRPNFVKMLPLLKILDESQHTHVLVHTGQHYDINMSDIFFNEMNAKRPDYNLEVGSDSHGNQTGEILKKTEEVLLKEEPDIVIVPGDGVRLLLIHITVPHI